MGGGGIFDGKVILVTGASSGIGKATATYLSECGATLVLVARNEKVLHEIAASLDCCAYVLACDLSHVHNIQSIFSFLSENHLKMDGLVHSAGAVVNAPLSLFDYQEALLLFNVNFFSFCEMLKFCTKKKFMNEGASIVAISSIAAMQGAKAQAVYASSKSALEGYMRPAAKELMARNVRVNAIEPAMVDTSMAAQTFETIEGASERTSRIQPLGLIDPSVLAKSVAFLLSDDARYLTGRIIPYDAGFLSVDTTG